MDVVFENISSLIVFTILFLVVYAALLNVYFIHKNGFYVSVNCWFCNKNSKVLYRKRNSFECPFCSQYNGFNKNGDYNRVITAQHNISLNHTNLTHNEKIGHLIPQTANGLCDSCNKNQQLRVLQLANYEPLNQKNYEKEIEHFERQLEKTYKLCKNCSKVLKNTIRKQNAWIFGNKLKNLKSPNKKGLFAVKRKKQSQGSTEDSKFYRKFSVVRFVLLIFSGVNLFFLCGFDSFIPKYLPPEVSLPSNVIFSTIYSKIHKVSIKKFGYLSFIRHLPKTLIIQEPNTLLISVLGFIIELFFTLIENNCTFFGKLNKLLSWIILGLISTVRFKSDILVYISTLQIFCSLWLIYSYGSSFIYLQGNQPKKFVIKRLRKTYENKGYSDNEESSSDSLNNSGATYRTAVNKHSPITANSSLNNSLNKSFESVRSAKTAPLFNSTFTHNNEYTARNLELNKHFNDLNLGALEANRPMSCQSYQRPSSPNPFFNYNRPQSSNGMFNYGIGYNSPGSTCSMQPPQTQLFKMQNPVVSSSFGNAGNSSFADNQATYLNQTRNLSPRSDRPERMSVQSQPYTLASNPNNLGFSNNNQQSTSFLLQNNKDYKNLSPYSATMTQRSPTYSLRSQSGQNALFVHNNHQAHNTFRPLSPVSSMERPSRAFLSPSKLNLVKSFHSEGKENENMSLSFHTGNAPASSFWSNLGGPQLHQRFVVNSVPDMQCISPLNGEFVVANTEKNPLGNSRSSSSSSGFISNGDFTKVQTRSLPNSRDHSPDRNSLISEPAYHFKMD